MYEERWLSPEIAPVLILSQEVLAIRKTRDIKDMYVDLRYDVDVGGGCVLEVWEVRVYLSVAPHVLFPSVYGGYLPTLPVRRLFSVELLG